MKQHKTLLIVTSLLTLAPLAAGLLLWGQLPDPMPTHFDLNGVPDGWSSKLLAVVGIPLILLAAHLICLGFTLHDPKRQNISDKLLLILFWIVPVLSCMCGFMMFSFALGRPVDIGMITSILLGIIFLILGNYMTKAHQNYTIGIKLPWTLHSEENWNRTHRLASRLFILSGLVFLVNILFRSAALVLIPCLVCIAVPALYSYGLYKKGI